MDQVIEQVRISHIILLLSILLNGDYYDNIKDEIVLRRFLVSLHVINVDLSAAEVSKLFRTFLGKLQNFLRNHC